MRRLPTTSWILIGALGCASASAAAAPPPAASPAPSTSAPAPAKPAAKPAPAAAKPRKPEEILADTARATGAEPPRSAHKTIHVKLKTTLQGMGIGGAGERFQTSTDKCG